jgi:hypothetical protein
MICFEIVCCTSINIFYFCSKIYIYILFFFVSVSDLLDYINPDDELKARELYKKQARAKVFSYPGSSIETKYIYTPLMVILICAH